MRTLAFGTLERGPWGAACSASPDLALLAQSATEAADWTPLTTFTGSRHDEDWRLSSDRIQLDVSGSGEPAQMAADDRAIGFEQLCRVHGQVILDGTELAIDCPGLRGARADVDPQSYESIRRVAMWFGSGEGIALLALRPRKARGQDRDIVSAAVLESSAATVIAEPRLSTTYTSAGIPARAGLELWSSEDESEQYPRRAAGESVTTGAAVVDQGLEIRGQPFRWHRRDEEGAGVYLLVRSR